MSDSPLLQRYAAARGDRGPLSPTTADAESPEDMGAYGWLRGIRDRAIMLELRKKDGTCLAIGYAYLERLAFDPSEGITLHAVGGQIRIRGRNLNAEVRPNVRLYEGITRHRISWIQEADRAASMQAAETDTVVESIVW